MIKKILSLTLAVAICASMSVSAFATSGYGELDKPSSNVDSTGVVKSDDISKQTEAAVAEIVKAGTGAKAEVVVTNAKEITPDVLKSMAAAATKAGGSALLMSDTVVDGKIVSRMYINPAQAANLKENIKLGIKLDDKSTQYTKDKFSVFENKIAVASLEQKGAIGMTVSVAVKMDLSDMNTKNLKFYTYNMDTNKYLPVAAPSYWIDKAGYLHFNVSVGGEIIVSNGALTLKK